MKVLYTVKNYAGVKGDDRTAEMQLDQVLANLKSAGCSLNLDKLAEAVSYGFGIILDELQIEIRLAK